MYQTLKNLTPGQQVGVMFVIVFGLLVMASLSVFMLSMREFEDHVADEKHRDRIHDLSALLRTSWAMIFVFWIAWLAGDITRLVLFGVGSFFALREFLTLSPTRQGDHRSLVLALVVMKLTHAQLSAHMSQSALGLLVEAELVQMGWVSLVGCSLLGHHS